MSRQDRKEMKKLMNKMGKSKSARALTYEYIYRQSKGLSWDSRECYGVGLATEQDLCRMGFDYMRRA